MLLKVLLPTLRLPGYRSAAVSSAFGDRHTIRTATASNAADGRRIMNWTSQYMHQMAVKQLTKQHKGMTKK